MEAAFLFFGPSELRSRGQAELISLWRKETLAKEKNNSSLRSVIID